METEQFALQASGIFGDTFGKRAVDLLAITEGLKNVQPAVKALVEQFGKIRPGGLLDRFKLLEPAQLDQFLIDIRRVDAAVGDLRARISEQLVGVRESLLGDFEGPELENQLSKIAQALGELIGQENQVIAFQQAMEDVNLVLSLIAGTADLTTLTFDQLTAAVSRLGIALEDVDIKGTGMFVRIKKELPALIDITAQINTLISSSLAALGGLFANLLTGAEAPLKKFAAAILGILGDLAIQLGTLFIAMGIGWIALRRGFLNPAALIAAGAALIVVGGLIKGIAGSLAAGDMSGGTGGGAAIQDTGPLEFTVPLSSISPRQGIAEDDRLSSTLDRLNENLGRIEAQDGVLIVKDGVRRSGGVSGLLTSADRQQLTQTVLRQPTLNNF